MKTIGSLLGCLLLTNLSFSQSLVQDFDQGLPNSWLQYSNDSIFWSGNDSLGINGSGCAVADFSFNSTMGASILYTPFVDLSGVSDPQVSFSIALTGIFFVAPELTLWYDLGGGLSPQKIGSWGAFTADSTIAFSFDHSPPLDSMNTTWVHLTVDLPQLANVPSVSLGFSADFPNGGWVLLDNLTVQSASIGLKEYEGSFDLYPNPTKGTLSVNHNLMDVEKIEVHNLMGQLLKSYPASENSLINLSAYPKGVYTISLITANGLRHSQKVVKD